MTQKTKKLAIVVGHEKLRPGAKIGPPLNTDEYSFNSMISSLMFRFAIEKDMEAKVFYRDGTGISGVGKALSEWGAGCAIELHCNSADPKAFGTETLFDLDPISNKELAWLCQKAMVSVFKRQGKGDRGAKSVKEGDRGHYNLAVQKVPSVILEPFFGSNLGDCKLAWANSVSYCVSIIKAVVEFLDNEQTKANHSKI